MSSSNNESLLINLWSGPRSLSTATMYSFSRRSDTLVYDEPLYAFWCLNNPHLYRPYREELYQAHSTDGNIVIDELLSKKSKRITFSKTLAKQVEGLDLSKLYQKNSKHIILIRDPLDMILAWDRKAEVHQEPCSLETMSLLGLAKIYSDVRSKTGEDPIVIDSEMLKEYPKEVLTETCSRLGIDFDESMLSWPAGPKPGVDGLWAKYWYDTLHETTGFGSTSCSTKQGARKYYTAMTVAQMETYREALPIYEFLKRKAIGVDSIRPDSSKIERPLFSSVLDLTSIPFEDERNKHVLIWVGNRLLPRELAKVSVFDSAVQGGDAVWEGIRVYENAIFRLYEHIERLQHSAKGMHFSHIPSTAYIINAIHQTLSANGMKNSAHMRMTLTRGGKITSSMNPSFNIYGSNLLIVPEWKPVGNKATYDNSKGIKLITAANRRNPPQCVDSKIHHNNLINNILPKIQAINAGAADALMLDMDGFVSETNATNVFMIKNGVVFTPFADACLPGITRQTVIDLCPKIGLVVKEARLSLLEFQTADEVFTTGTMGELTPVYQIDQRKIGNISPSSTSRLKPPFDQVNWEVLEESTVDYEYPGKITLKLQEAFQAIIRAEAIPLPF